MNMHAVVVGVTIASALVLVAACGGTEDQQAAPPEYAQKASSQYATVVESTYAWAHKSFGETVDPCLARRYALCDRHGRRARAAAQALLDRLARIEPPVRAKAADRHLREAFTALVAAQDVQRRAIEAQDDAAFSRSISDITVAIGEIESARIEINDALPALNLPAMH
jgi:hypothetical protein